MLKLHFILLGFLSSASVLAEAGTPEPVKAEAEPTVKEESEEAEAEADAGEGKLTGNWNGARNKLKAQGIEVGLYYSGEGVVNADGGVAFGGTYMGKATAALDLDLEKLMGMSGWTFHTSAIAMHGRGPSFLTGDAQWTSNIEATPAVRLYDVWLQKQFTESGSSLLFGLYDWNSEFNITDSSVTFLNSSFGEGLELTQSPMNGTIIPSTYPNTTLGVRAMVNASEGYYLGAAVVDGVAGDPNDPLGAHIILGADDGLFVGTEFGYKTPEDSKEEVHEKWVVGFWAYTQAVDTILTAETASPVKAVDYGAYLLGERTVTGNLTAFARIGWANPDVNQITASLATGLLWDKVSGKDASDQIGLGLSTVWNGAAYMQYQDGQGAPTGQTETALEVFYRFEAAPGLTIQPDLQYVIKPSMDPSLKDATNFFIRFDLAL